MRFIPLLCLLLAGCGSSEPAHPEAKPADASSAQPAATGARLRSIGRFSAPIYVATAPGDTHRLFVVQRGGSVVVLRDGRRSGTFLRVATTTDGERGLLSIAFPPDYAQSGLVYAYSTAPNGDIRIDEFHAAPDADRVDARARPRGR